MRLLISDNTKKAMVILQLNNFPFTKEEVKDRFKESIKKAHPDVGGSDEQAKKVLSAYNILKNLCIENIKEEKPPEEIQLKTGFWTACDFCNGSGTKLKKVKSLIVCPTCDDDGHWCRHCHKTGYIETFIGKLAKVDCPICHGKGKVVVDPFNPVVIKEAILC